MFDSEYSVIKNDVMNRYDCIKTIILFDINGLINDIMGGSFQDYS